MTKISFDVDFSKDPEKILQEIQERAKAEVEKRENKERNSAFLSKLHETVNEKIGTDYKSVSDLIKALTPFAAPSLREKLTGTTASGRRKTVSMSKEIYDEVKKSLSEPNPNKAAIARKSGISVVQVRKIADGGFDKKFGGDASFAKPTSPKAPPPSLSIKTPSIEEEKEEVKEESPLPPPIIEDIEPEKPELPPVNFDSDPEPEIAPLPSPSFGDDDATDLPPPAPVDLAPPPAPEPPVIEDSPEAEESSVPPLPSFAPLPPPEPEESTSQTDTEDLPPPPSFGDDDSSEPALPPVDLAPPPAPDLPTPPPLGDDTPSSEEILPPPPGIQNLFLIHLHRSLMKQWIIRTCPHFHLLETMQRTHLHRLQRFRIWLHRQSLIFLPLHLQNLFLTHLLYLIFHPLLPRNRLPSLLRKNHPPPPFLMFHRPCRKNHHQCQHRLRQNHLAQANLA